MQRNEIPGVRKLNELDRISYDNRLSMWRSDGNIFQIMLCMVVGCLNRFSFAWNIRHLSTIM